MAIDTGGLDDDLDSDRDGSLLHRIAESTREKLDGEVIPDDLADAVVALLAGSGSAEPNEWLSTLSSSEGNGDAADEAQDP